MLRDLAFAGRTLARSPGFAATAALTIGLGIGACAAVFTIVHAVLLKQLPYRDPDRLAIVYGDLRTRATYGIPFSNENFVDIRNAVKGTFEDLAGVSTDRQVVIGEDGTPDLIRFGTVTPNFFRMMGARLVLGRDFEDADGLPQPETDPGATLDSQNRLLPTRVILTYEFWQRRYGGNPAVLGQRLGTGRWRGHEIVGVLARGFQLLFPPGDSMETVPEVWIANRLRYDNANRNRYALRAVGRLKANATWASAQAEVDAAAEYIRRQFPLFATAGFAARVEPMHATVVKEVRPAILALMGAAVFLLVIACANVANLLLVRSRESEMAVRSVLGAGRWRLIRQNLADAILITALGTAGGIVLAWMGVRALRIIAPANVPRLEEIQISAFVLACVVFAGLLAAAGFGLLSAAASMGHDPVTVLRGSGRTGARRGGTTFRHVVVVAEVALSLVLLIGSGLMFRSFLELQRIDPGFDASRLLTFRLLGDSIGRGPHADRAVYTRQIEERLRAISGVEGVASSFPFPLTGEFSTIRWGTEDALADNTKFQAADWQLVRPGYFQTLGTRLIEGRTFTEADDDPARGVVVIDEVLAAKAFPHRSSIGKRILIRIRTAQPEWVEVIGVVAHQRAVSLSEPGREQLYVTAGFLGVAPPNWAIRTGSDPAAYADVLRAEMRRFDPQLVVTDVQPMESIVSHAQATTRFSLILIGVFATVAALLVGIGLYGVLSTVVRQRTPEIGIRMALGAAPTSILRLVVGLGLRLTVAGIAFGMVAAFALTRLMTALLVGVTATDPFTFAAMSVAFLVVAAMSCWVPARRAAALDPVAVLRQQ